MSYEWSHTSTEFNGGAEMLRGTLKISEASLLLVRLVKQKIKKALQLIVGEMYFNDPKKQPYMVLFYDYDYHHH